LELFAHRRLSEIWFISFPKSGRTWSKTIVENYISEYYGLPPFTFEDFHPYIRTGNWRKVPRMVFVHPHCRERDPEPVHEFIRQLEHKKVIFMVRDPRKVVVTYYYRLRKRMRDERALSLTLSEFIRDDELGIGRVVGFNNTWLNALGGFQSQLFIRFEDVRSDPIREITRYLSFLDIPIQASRLAEVIDKTPDQTTTAIEGSEVRLKPQDLDFMDRAISALDPRFGYQAGS